MQISLSVGGSLCWDFHAPGADWNLHFSVFLVPGYAIALILSLFVPKILQLLHLTLVVCLWTCNSHLSPSAGAEACEAVGGNIVTDAFGVVAMVAMTPLITLQVLGLVYPG